VSKAAHALLSVAGLRVETASGRALVDDVSFMVAAGETLAIVGESGSGKTLTALSLVGLVPEGVRVAAGRAMFQGRDLLALDEKALRQVRGAAIGMVFQEPMSALNPVVTIGVQMTEALRAHRGLDRCAATAAAVRALELVHLPRADELMRRYPHELSGGMRQRVMIAAAMVLEPPLLVADEPTTALDVTVQAEILALLEEVKAKLRTALILITHDMGVVAESGDRVLMLRQGRVQETGGVEAIFRAPRAAYTRELLAAVPRAEDGTRAAVLAAGAPAVAAEPVLKLENVTKIFATGGLFRRETFTAVDGVSFEIAAGETLALVGESGSGKSTLGRAVVRLVRVDRGRLLLEGKDIGAARGAALRAIRQQAQIVFQDPYASLDPRMTVGEAIAEPLVIQGLAHGRVARERTRALLEEVGLAPALAGHYPHELSGGQRQRVAIARAIGVGPRLLVADEPTSALDVSVQARVLELLAALQERLGLSYLFITHDLSVVRRIAHRVAVMRAGKLVEVGPARAVLDAPRHPYTRRLIDAAPVLDPRWARRRRAHMATAEASDGRWSVVGELEPGHWVAEWPAHTAAGHPTEQVAS
jgi:peptide/nickel transport system ATP-binding protein